MLESNGPSLLTYLKEYSARRSGPSEPIKVLVVDDEEPVRKFVQRVLADAGYRTEVAGDGYEALEVAQKSGQFDILVTDLLMPRMSGDELALRLRQVEPGLKVLYLTGYSDQFFKDTKLWEDEAFLDKPCSVKGLAEAVTQLFYGTLDTPLPAA